MPSTSTPKIKGIEVLNLVKALRLDKERAFAVLPKRLHHYLEERILVSTWYPEEDQLGLIQAMGALMPAGAEPWVMMGRSTGHSNLTGLYKHLLQPDNPERTLAFVSVFWRNAHDTGEMTAAQEAPGRAVVRLRGYALPSREMCGIIRGYLSEIVAMSGGKSVTAKHVQCVKDRAVDCAWQLTWS
jgi:hypothetical protein